MEDRVLIPVRAELVEQLERLAHRDIGAMDAMVDKALEGDPSTWRVPQVAMSPIGEPIMPLSLRCACCKGQCKNTFTWRGLTRCGC
jgi:hypothetical protein